MEEGAVRNNEVGDRVVRGIDHLNCAFTALSSARPDPVTASEVQTYNDPSKDPLSCMPMIRELVCRRLIRSVCSVSWLSFED